MKRTCLWSVAFIMAQVIFHSGGTTSAGAEDAKRFRYIKPIDRKLATDQEIVGVALDSEIYAATRDGFPDLRIFDSQGTEVPFQVEPETETRGEKVRHTDTPEVVSLTEKEGTIEVRLRLPKESPPAEGFSVVTPLADYVRKVQVFGSSDGLEWKLLAPDGMIFDYSRYMDVSQREIALPENKFRNFKLVIANVVDEKEFPLKELARTFRGREEAQRVEKTVVERRPLRIDRIDAWYHVVEQQPARAKKTVYPVASFKAEQDSEHKQTLLTIRTRREPLSSFTLQTAARNFHRRAVVQVPVTHDVARMGEVTRTVEWQPIAEEDIWNFHFRNDHREELTIRFPQQRQAEYRIVIENEDNPPLTIDGVSAEGDVYRAVFLAQPKTEYVVIYGSAQAEEPKYEAAAVLSALRGNNTVVTAALGKETPNPKFSTAADTTATSWLNNWYFLGPVIGLMVVVLAWGLFRAGRRLEKLPGE